MSSAKQTPRATLFARPSRRAPLASMKAAGPPREVATGSARPSPSALRGSTCLLKQRQPATKPASLATAPRHRLQQGCARPPPLPRPLPQQQPQQNQAQQLPCHPPQQPRQLNRRINLLAGKGGLTAAKPTLSMTMAMSETRALPNKLIRQTAPFLPTPNAGRSSLTAR